MDLPHLLILGEVLFDLFPDGPRLGGAPFNVAWHLAGLGDTPHFISRIGDDTNGARIRQQMTAHQMIPDGIQTDSDHPTGQVVISMEGADHTFKILPDQAYDHLQSAPVLASITAISPTLVYFGTLALRAEPSRSTILAAVEAVGANDGICFLDINLRQDCWTGNTLELALAHAAVVKLNDDELATLARLHGWQGNQAALLHTLQTHYALTGICLTRGADGAMWLDRSGLVETPAPSVTVVDTVGAGDALSAVLIHGLLHGWTMSVTLTRAVAFAARICAERGACPEDDSFYIDILSGWQAADQ